MPNNTDKFQAWLPHEKYDSSFHQITADSFSEAAEDELGSYLESRSDGRQSRHASSYNIRVRNCKTGVIKSVKVGVNSKGYLFTVISVKDYKPRKRTR